MKRIITLAACIAMAASMLGGCGYVRSKFGNKPDAYKKAEQSRPLEVPPDLEAPNTSGALVVPGTPAAASSASTAAVSGDDAASPPRVAVAAAAAPGGDGLRVVDTASSTWKRVGLALERSGAATIEARDEAGFSYQVVAQATTSARPGWFKRAITFGRAADKRVATRVPLNVRVQAEGEASIVTIEGGSDAASSKAARDLLEVLRQRLS